jgi:hypothetical protein
MSRIIVVTNPSYDIATSYLDSWFQPLFDLIRSKIDIEIHELKKEKVTRVEFENMLSNKNPRLVVLNGHGSHNSISGFNDDILVKTDLNIEILKDKIIHSVSCDSGKTLGPESIKTGSISFIGYKEEFKFVHQRDKRTQEEQLGDYVASLFLKPAYRVVEVLINGGTAEEAYAESQKMYLNNLRDVITSKNPNSMITSRLYHNLTHQVSLGNQQSKI